MRPLALGILALSLACAANPRPGEPGYRYNLDGDYDVRFIVGGDPYTGSLTAETAPGGAVTGSFRVSGEVTVTATFTGTVRGDSLAWTGSYALAEADCPGTFTAGGRIAEGGGSFSGDLRALGCEGDVETGTYTATR